MTTFVVDTNAVLHTTDHCPEFFGVAIGSVQRPGAMVVCADCEPAGVRWGSPAWGNPETCVHEARGGGMDAEGADE